jgi:hypothetical protein
MRIVIDGADPDSPQAQALIANNQDVIDQFVRVQRRNYDLGSIPIHKASTRTPDIGLTYQNQYGTEVLRITPYPVYPGASTPQPSVSQPIPKPSFPTPPTPPTFETYMLVLYGTNGVAALPMSTLPSVTPTYTGTVGRGNWQQYNPVLGVYGAPQIPVAQYRFGPAGVIMTPVDFTNGNEATSEYMLWTTQLLQNVAYDGLGTGLQVLDNATSQYNYDTIINNRCYPPVMNGSATAIYTPLQTFSMSADGHLAATGGGGDPSVPSYCISPDGDHYYDPTWADQVIVPTEAEFQQPGSTVHFFCVIDLEGTQFRRGGTTYALPGTTDTTIESTIGTSSTATANTENSFNWGWSYTVQSNTLGSATPTITYTTGYYTEVGGVIDYVVPFNANYSGTVAYPQYRVPSSTSLGSDQVLIEMVPVTATKTYANIATSVTSSDSMSVFGVTYSFSNPGAGYEVTGTWPHPAIQLQPFPPSLSNGTTTQYYYAHCDNRLSNAPYGSFESLNIVTPYGTFTGTTRNSFKPWLHVSNGAHYAQGFVIDGTPYLYLDGEDFLTPLVNGLSVPGSPALEPKDIHAIYMDIPLVSIQTMNNVSASIPPSD